MKEGEAEREGEGEREMLSRVSTDKIVPPGRTKSHGQTLTEQTVTYPVSIVLNVEV